MRFLTLCIAAGLTLSAMTERASAQSEGYPLIGQMGVFAFDYCPKGWIVADGSILQINEHISLFSLIGTVFGGDGESTFAVPDMRSTAIAGVTSGKLDYGTPGSLGSVITITEGEADESPLKAMQMTVCIANIGIYPAR